MEPQISLSNPGSQTSGICECEFDKVQLPSDKPFQFLQKALNLFLKKYFQADELEAKTHTRLQYRQSSVAEKSNKTVFGSS